MNYFLQYYYLVPIPLAFVSTVIGLKSYKYIPRSVQLLILSSFLSLSVDVFSLFSNYKNIEIHNVYFFADFFLLLFATHDLLRFKYRIVFYIMLSALFSGTWFYFIFKDGSDVLANMAFVASSFLIVVNFLVLLYQNESKPISGASVPIRILCSSILVYYCGTFTLFLAIKPYLINQNIPDWFMDINTILDSIKFILLGTAFYKFKQRYLELNRNR